MILFPAIDLFEGKAVRLFKGDYAGANKGDIVEKWQDAVVGD